MEHYFFLFSILFFTPGSGYSNNDSYIGIECFSIERSVSDYYNSLDILLFQRLTFELLPQGVKPLLITDTTSESCIATITGEISSFEDKPILTITISSATETGEEIKKIPLENHPTDEIVDLMAIKVRNFLEQNISGKLQITSTPLDCDILLNGVKIGKTPAELVLEHGTYSVELQKEYLHPHLESISINAGQQASIAAALKFEGHAVKPWITSGLIFSGCVLAAQVIESKLHAEYKNIKSSDGDEFTRKWNQYRIANTIKVILLIPMATSWSISGYQFLENRSLKTRIFSQ